jgi:hypothetical protein
MLGGLLRMTGLLLKNLMKGCPLMMIGYLVDLMQRYQLIVRRKLS